MAAFQLVRLKRGKTTLEILCKPGTPLEYRKGNIGSLDNVLISDDIFKNQAKGEKANSSDLIDACETEDVQTCIKLILEKGEIQLTAAERKAKTEKKRAEIINYIHKYYVDPKTKLPHPVVRIDAALTEMKFRVDGDLPVERQIQEAVKKLPEYIPIKKMEISGILTIPHKHMGLAPNILHKYNISARTERYTGEGCVMEISLVPGDYDSLLGDLNNSLSGEFQFEVEGDGGAVASEPEPAKGKGKGKGKAARGGGGGGGKGRGGRN